MTRVALTLMLVVLARGVAAQETEPAKWVAGLTWTGERFEDATPRWEDWSALEGRLERRFGGGSAAFEGGWFRRFGRHDAMGGADVYADLWPSAYGNLRVRLAPDADAIARTDAAIELFQGFSGGWEPSVGYRQSRYADGTVRSFGVAAARYLGRWYARVRIDHARRSGTGGTSFGALVRRTLRTEEERAEASFAVGNEIVTVPGPGGELETRLRATTTAALAARVRIGGPVDVGADLRFTTFEGAPTRAGAGVGLILRR